MIRLRVLVEGPTERDFVNEVLAPHLYMHGFMSVSARLLGNSRLNNKRGGIRGWPEVRGNIVRLLREDRDCFATTMVDYYGLPASGGRKWPGRKKAAKIRYPENVERVEMELANDIHERMGADFSKNRFIPFLMMHEFEALLFSDCKRFSDAIGQPNVADSLQEIRREFSTPEEINDSPEGAPSKRLGKLIRSYRKPLTGVLGVKAIELPRIRAECPHFSGWLSRLEGLPADSREDQNIPNQ